MVYSMLHINSISFSALKPLASVRRMRRLRCSELFLTLSSLRYIPIPTMIGGTDSLYPVSLRELARAAQTP